MKTRAARLLHCAFPIAGLALSALAPLPARADFFDDARKTFTTDIPHFFQDDIPCAFGGQPTSGTKASCDSKSGRPQAAPGKNRDATVPPPKPDPGGSTSPPPSGGQ